MRTNDRRPGREPQASKTTNDLTSSVDPFELFVEAVADKVIERLGRSANAAWIDQSASPLGRCRHCAAVKRRVANGEGGGRIVGRRHELSPEALQHEVDTVSRGRLRRTTKAEPSNVVADLERALRVVAGGHK